MVTSTRERPGAPTPFGAVVLVVEGHWMWYRRNWRASVVNSVLQPVLALIAFGVFFGRLAERGDGLAAVTGGVDYLVYLTPALLCAAALQTAAAESSFPVFAGFQWQRTYLAVTATPVTPNQLATGQLCWVGLRVAVTSVIYLAVAAAFGGVRSLGIVGALGAAVLTAAAFSAPVAALAASQRRMNQSFNILFRFVVVPMTLFAGTYFPVDRLPEWAQVVAVVTPLWHGTELARAAVLGGTQLGGTGLLGVLGHLGYLLVWVVAGLALAQWRFRVRLRA